MAYSICNDGVKQDHKGRKFRLARYPNGKVIEVPYTETGTKEVGYTIPVPKDPVRLPRKKHNVLHVPKRLHVVQFRDHKVVRENGNYTDEERALLQPLVRLSGDKVVQILQPADFDHHNQYHIDQEEK